MSITFIMTSLISNVRIAVLLTASDSSLLISLATSLATAIGLLLRLSANDGPTSNWWRSELSTSVSATSSVSFSILSAISAGVSSVLNLREYSSTSTLNSSASSALIFFHASKYASASDTSATSPLGKVTVSLSSEHAVSIDVSANVAIISRFIMTSPFDLFLFVYINGHIFASIQTVYVKNLRSLIIVYFCNVTDFIGAV